VSEIPTSASSCGHPLSIAKRSSREFPHSFLEGVVSTNTCTVIPKVSDAAKTVRTIERIEIAVAGRRSFYFWFALVCVPLVLGTFLLFRSRNLSVNWQFLWPILKVCGLFLAVGIVAGLAAWSESRENARRKWRRLRSGCFLAIWSFLLAAVLRLTPFALARSTFPLCDVTLAKLDSFLGVSVPAVVTWCRVHSFWWGWSVRVYGTLVPFVFAAIIVPALSGKVRVSQRLLLSTLFSSILAFALFTCFPAIGPWAGNRFTPALNQDFYVRELMALRGPGLFEANPAYTCGQITFPSFHVVLAILSASAFWPFRWLHFPASILAVCICVSTVTVGWHYAVDGVAGAAVALTAIAAADWILRFASHNSTIENLP
jgi:PAP2 superfamily